LYEIGLAPYDAEQVSAELQAMGHVDVDIIPMWISKLTTIQVVIDGSGEVMLVGGVDQRSDGSIGGTNSNLSEPIILMHLSVCRLHPSCSWAHMLLFVPP
jgi:hypothetical protein